MGEGGWKGGEYENEKNALNAHGGREKREREIMCFTCYAEAGGGGRETLSGFFTHPLLFPSPLPPPSLFLFAYQRLAVFLGCDSEGRGS